MGRIVTQLPTPVLGRRKKQRGNRWHIACLAVTAERKVVYGYDNDIFKYECITAVGS
jgi:hypothetical protein